VSAVNLIAKEIKSELRRRRIKKHVKVQAEKAEEKAK
jgi:hypothetical protein